MEKEWKINERDRKTQGAIWVELEWMEPYEATSRKIGPTAVQYTKKHGVLGTSQLSPQSYKTR